MVALENLRWKYSHFNELSNREVHDILTLRQEVFVVEQECAYLDADGYDPVAWHFRAEDDLGLAAYARVLAPKPLGKFEDHPFGRVITAMRYRGIGLGRLLLANVLEVIEENVGQVPLCISAQFHLADYYSAGGFVARGEIYDEDGIPHVQMIRHPEKLD